MCLYCRARRADSAADGTSVFAVTSGSAAFLRAPRTRIYLNRFRSASLLIADPDRTSLLRPSVDARRTTEDPMRSKTLAQDDEGARRHQGRALAAGQSTTRERANDSIAESQRIDKLAALPLKLLRFTDVRERTGLSRSTVWRLERRGAFPKHVQLSANIVGWLEEDVIEWIRSRASGSVA